MTAQSLSRRQFGRLTLGVVSFAAFGGVNRSAAATEIPAVGALLMRVAATADGASLRIAVYLTNQGEGRYLSSRSSLSGVLTRTDGIETTFVAQREAQPTDIVTRRTPFEIVAIPAAQESFCGVWVTDLLELQGLPSLPVLAELPELSGASSELPELPELPVLPGLQSAAGGRLLASLEAYFDANIEDPPLILQADPVTVV